MMRTQKQVQIGVFLGILSIPVWPSVSWSAGSQGGQQQAQPPAPPIQEPTRVSSGPNGEKPQFRNFYEVLEDLTGDFEYDIKNGGVSGLKELSIRNVATSENIPPSFKAHLELAVTEKILKNSKAHVIQCLQCKAKKTVVNGDQVVISSPENNPVEMSRIAKSVGILHFMDVAFSYQSSGMMLSMYIVDPENGNIIWSRTYNSETSRASAMRRGVDYNQIEDIRKQSEYVPTLQHRAIVYFLFEKDVSTYTGCLAFGYRLVERYDSRNKEVGFELNYIRDTATIVSSAAAAASTGTTTNSLYSGINLTMLFVHSWNFIGEEENYNKVRGNLFLAAGGTYASGFLGGLVRSGYEWRMAKHWAVSGVLGFRPPATAFFGVTKVDSISGIEAGLGINALF